MSLKIIFTLAILHLAKVSAVIYLRAGDTCDNSDVERICDPSLFLNCINSICGCNDTLQLEQPASYILATCAIKLGQVCQSDVDPAKPGCIINSKCVTKSEIDLNGICTCVEPDSPSPDGDFCYHLADKTSEFCGQLMPGVTCNAEGKLFCSSGSRCTCEEGWISAGGCYANYTYPCKTSSNHTWELCPPPAYGEYHLKCSSEENGQCECLFHEENIWIPNPSGGPGTFPGCYFRPGASCEDIQEHEMYCVELSRCRGISPNRVCTCVDYFAPNDDSTLCLHAPAELLEYGENCRDTYPRAVCNSFNMLECDYPCFDCVCVCQSGYSINTALNLCQAAHGSVCDSVEGAPFPNMTCNSEEFLTCVDSNCACENEATQYFNPITSECGLLAHENCTTQPNTIRCTLGTTCQHIQDNTSRCRCPTRMKATENRTACEQNPTLVILSFNETCDIWDVETSFCNNLQDLSCQGSICSCPSEGHVWNAEWESCYAGYQTDCVPFSTLVEGPMSHFSWA
ncbi:multiple epidermal growth factor-like domains protein 10 isoform X2 [Folsomia candida]|uniref:multiple epidermal growth factor-like domains protein 10 isoform X2 n=1 Tax=Folsomia candida TaxID=158441 RepID=UPI001604EF1E|nr:multiple epidermal growth factor-like domains protein 10 isoform X2 [Folsomia candida]